MFFWFSVCVCVTFVCFVFHFLSVLEATRGMYTMCTTQFYAPLYVFSFLLKHFLVSICYTFFFYRFLSLCLSACLLLCVLNVLILFNAYILHFTACAGVAVCKIEFCVSFFVFFSLNTAKHRIESHACV